MEAKEDILDRMGRAELAANEFRNTQTEEKLIQQGAIGEINAMETHLEVGSEVRQAIERIGGRMPEELPIACCFSTVEIPTTVKLRVYNIRERNMYR